jgi:hypothetical protein
MGAIREKIKTRGLIMTDKIDITRPLKTRDGRAVEGLKALFREPGAFFPRFNLVGLIKGFGDSMHRHYWDECGKYQYYGNHPFDLIYADEDQRQSEVIYYGPPGGPSFWRGVQKEEKKMIDWDRPLQGRRVGAKKWLHAYKAAALFEQNGNLTRYKVNVQVAEDCWDSPIFAANGLLLSEYEDYEIRNAPEKRKIEKWANIYLSLYKEGGIVIGGLYDTKQEANYSASYANPKPIACLKIEREYVEGEGLEGGE